MRPCGPDPATCRRSIPASFARRRIAGEVNTRRLESGSVAVTIPALLPLAEAGEPWRAAPLPMAATALLSSPGGTRGPPPLPAAVDRCAAVEGRAAVGD